MVPTRPDTSPPPTRVGVDFHGPTVMKPAGSGVDDRLALPLGALQRTGLAPPPAAQESGRIRRRSARRGNDPAGLAAPLDRAPRHDTRSQAPHPWPIVPRSVGSTIRSARRCSAEPNRARAVTPGVVVGIENRLTRFRAVDALDFDAGGDVLVLAAVEDIPPLCLGERREVHERDLVQEAGDAGLGFRAYEIIQHAGDRCLQAGDRHGGYSFSGLFSRDPPRAAQPDGRGKGALRRRRLRGTGPTRIRRLAESMGRTHPLSPAGRTAVALPSSRLPSPAVLFSISAAIVFASSS